VAARNAVGSGPAASATATTSAVPGATAAPSAKKGKKGGRRTASIRWTGPTTDGGTPVTGYTVLVYLATGALLRTVAGLGAGVATYTFRGRAGKYRFAVVALNAVGAGPASALSRPVKAR
jgi:hypothetical protein